MEKIKNAITAQEIKIRGKLKCTTDFAKDIKET